MIREVWNFWWARERGKSEERRRNCLLLNFASFSLFVCVCGGEWMDGGWEMMSNGWMHERNLFKNVGWVIMKMVTIQKASMQRLSGESAESEIRGDEMKWWRNVVGESLGCFHPQNYTTDVYTIFFREWEWFIVFLIFRLDSLIPDEEQLLVWFSLSSEKQTKKYITCSLSWWNEARFRCEERLRISHLSIFPLTFSFPSFRWKFGLQLRNNILAGGITMKMETE